MDLPDARPLVRLSKGSHLVFARRDVPLNTSLVFFSPLDGRPLVLSRRRGCFLYGTTDAWEGDGPGEPRPGEEDCEYLLSSLREALPDAGLDAGRVRFAYSGFRALPAATHAGGPEDVPREECLEVSRSGLITLVGGKLTTARRIAVGVLDQVIAGIGRRPGWKRSETHRHPVGGGVTTGEAGVVGLRAACRTEMVCTLEDLVERRLDTLSWSIRRRLHFLRCNAWLLQSELGLDAEEFEEQYQAYRLRLARLHTSKGGCGSSFPAHDLVAAHALYRR
jgi:glycerol-3-phosphate dehydrogenase